MLHGEAFALRSCGKVGLSRKLLSSDGILATASVWHCQYWQ
jgi:hypothetical protein